MLRDTGGVVRIQAEGLPSALRQLGIAHATDRPAQMALMRILAKGQACECLADEPELLELDRFFRWLGLYRGVEAQLSELGERERCALKAYCEGVNATMESRPRPIPFRLWGYRWQPWTPGDVATLMRLMAWAGLVSAQFANELAIVELVQAGVSEQKLVELMGPVLEGCDFALLREIELTRRLTPAVLAAHRKVGSFAGSNAWAVAPSRTRSGKALLANDMHLEVNRLPAVWYEAVLEYGGGAVLGTTVPGLPGIVTGRNRSLAWGATYTQADTCDFFVEDCRDGKYLREDEWKCFERIDETIRRKKHPEEALEVFRNDHGLLLGDPRKSGKYLCLAWSAWHCSIGEILSGMYDLATASTVEEGMGAIATMHFPALNWVFADSAGNIGYRMGGLVPRRRAGWSGLYPVPGWVSENDWQGFLEPAEVPTVLNPVQGYVANANQDINGLGKRAVQTLPLNDNRYRRICQRLEAQSALGVDDLQAIQLDVYSLKAERLVPIFAAALPEGGIRDVLLGWNLEFDVDSKAATLFTELYERALAAVFCGRDGCIPEAMFKHLLKETTAGLVLDLAFERVLRSERSLWYGDRSREDILRQAFASVPTEPRDRWGTLNRITMENIFFGGKLPRFLGLDRHGVEMPGSPDTPRQGTRFRDAGRATSYCPSNRFVTDMGTQEAWTVIPGGPSEKRFSGLYLTDVEKWQRGEYKRLTLQKAARSP